MPRWCVVGAIAPTLAGIILVLPTVRRIWQCVRWPIEGVAGMPGRIAAESLRRRADRNGVTVAAIAASISIAVAVSSLAGSFRASIGHVYLLIGDLVLVSRHTQGWVSTPVSGEVARDLARIPGIARVDTVRIAQGQRYQGQRVAVVGLSDSFFEQARERGGRFGARDWEQTLATLTAGRGLLVSENFATHFGVRIGDVLGVPSPVAFLELPVLGTIPDYSSDRGAILLARDLYQRHWRDSLVNYVIVTLAEGVTVPEIRQSLRSLLARLPQVMMLETAGLVAKLDDAVARAFADMNAIQVLVLVIALAGIGDLLVSNTLDRTRELAIWRAIGSTERVLVKATVWEAVAIGLVGACFGILIGVGSSWLWIRFSYPSLVGYVLAFHFSWGAAVGCGCLATGGAALAGCVAGWGAARRPIDEGLRYE